MEVEQKRYKNQFWSSMLNGPADEERTQKPSRKEGQIKPGDLNAKQPKQ